MSELKPITCESAPVIFTIIAEAEMEIMRITGSVVRLEMNVKDEFLIADREIAKMELQQQVCTLFSVSWKEMIGRNRKRRIVDARKAYSFLAFYCLKISKSEIGRDLDKDHTTILHLISATVDHIEVGDPIKNKIKSIKTKLYEHHS